MESGEVATWKNRRESAAYSAFVLRHSLRGRLDDPVGLILFSFLIPGLTSSARAHYWTACHRRAYHRGICPTGRGLGGADGLPFAGLIQSARFYLIFLLLVWVGAMVHAWFAARKFNRKNGIELR